MGGFLLNEDFHLKGVNKQALIGMVHISTILFGILSLALFQGQEEGDNCKVDVIEFVVDVLWKYITYYLFVKYMNYNAVWIDLNSYSLLHAH